MGEEYITQFAEIQDIDPWMHMIEIIKSNFPGLETAEMLRSYRETVIKNMNRRTAICTKYAGEVVGIIIFSYHAKCLSCMAVDPNHRRKGIATAMIEMMLSLFPRDADISVTTFREHDPKGIAPRALYQKFGFVEAELVEEFHYPHQKFVLHIN